jgi:chorismate dehydratase
MMSEPPEDDNPASSLEALDGLRIGCVQYLNSRPLVEPYAGKVVLRHPSALAAGLVRGELDVALVPVFEALRSPSFPIVDGVSISAQGPVWSVFLAFQGALEEVRTVSLDPASLTSVNLCKVIFAEWADDVPAYVPEPAPAGAAQLLIGNQAIEFRERHGSAFEYLDFGEEWNRRTGLPFVFAVWLMRPELPQPQRVAAAFREIARLGQAQISEIVARHPEHGAAFTERYLTQHIRYGLGRAEKEGMGCFRELLWKHRLLARCEQPLRFV